MPFFLENPDEYANANLTRVPLPILPPGDSRYYREYCWVLEGTIRGHMIEIHGPQEALAFEYSPVYLSGYFEVEGPSRVISIKEYVQLYNQSRMQQGLSPFQWHESVYACIRALDEDDAQKKKK